MTAIVSPPAASRTGSAVHGTPTAAHDDRARLGALVAGVGYVALFVFAMAGNFGVVERLVVDGDAAATTANRIACSWKIGTPSVFSSTFLTASLG